MIKDIVSYLSEGYSPNSLPSLGYWASQNMDKIYLKRKRKYPLVFNASINTGVVVVVFISSSNIDQLEDRKKIETNCGQPKDGRDEFFFWRPALNTNTSSVLCRDHSRFLSVTGKG